MVKHCHLVLIWWDYRSISALNARDNHTYYILMPPAGLSGSLNNFVHNSDSYLLSIFCSLCSCLRNFNDQLWIVVVIPLRLITMTVNHLMFRKQPPRIQCQPFSKQINPTANTQKSNICWRDVNDALSAAWQLHGLFVREQQTDGDEWGKTRQPSSGLLWSTFSSSLGMRMNV